MDHSSEFLTQTVFFKNLYISFKRKNCKKKNSFLKSLKKKKSWISLKRNLEKSLKNDGFSN